MASFQNSKQLKTSKDCKCIFLHSYIFFSKFSFFSLFFLLFFRSYLESHQTFTDSKLAIIVHRDNDDENDDDSDDDDDLFGNESGFEDEKDVIDNANESLTIEEECWD